MFEYENKKPNVMKYLVLGGLIILAGVGSVTAYLYATPYLRLWQLRNAVVEKDHKTVSSYVDFPSLKQSLKDELNAFMMQEMANNSELKNNPFSGFALALAPTMVNNMVEAFVTPAGVERLLSGNVQSADGEPKGEEPPNFFSDPGVEMGYASLNEFWVVVPNEKGQRVALVFERHWIGDWKLAGIRMPRNRPSK